MVKCCFFTLTLKTNNVTLKGRMFQMTADESHFIESSDMTQGIIPDLQAGWADSRLKEKYKIPQGMEEK